MKIFKILKDKVKDHDTGKIVSSNDIEAISNISEKRFVKVDEKDIKNQQLLFGSAKTSPGPVMALKLSIVEKAKKGDYFTVVDNPDGEIEYLAKNIGLDYIVSTEHGEKKVIFNPYNKGDDNE